MKELRGAGTDSRNSSKTKASGGGVLHPYAATVLEDLTRRVPWEVEFLQAVHEVFETLGPVLERDPTYEGERILERIVEPERVHSFRVVWTDDTGQVRVNRGHRVQFNATLGPYKGGLRFHASVSLGGLKFLGFEQTFKNALTGLPMGGGKGGADFQASFHSDGEVMRFCHAFMSSLYHHIGPDRDVPAGDIGVGGREIGYLFGKYRHLTGNFHGTLTGKGLGWGGSRLRPEATGYGVIYFLEDMLKEAGRSIEGLQVAVSGFGNVAWGAVKKATELGARVVTLSGPDGFVHDPDGVSGEKIDFMLRMRASGRDVVRPYADKFGVAFHEGHRPWEVPCDVAIPCAIQNELDAADARRLAAGGCRFVVEGANMPTTPGAVDVLREAGISYAPGKATNAGGVAVSGLEMTQNRTGQRWTAEAVDAELRTIMSGIHRQCVEAAKAHGRPGDYLAGANLASFVRVANAMLEQGAV